MSETLVINILLGLLTAGVAFAGIRLTARQTRSQAQAAIVAVDAAAYERAKGIYESAIGQLQRENDDLRKQRDQAVDDREVLRADRNRTRDDNRALVTELLRHGGSWPPAKPG